MKYLKKLQILALLPLMVAIGCNQGDEPTIVPSAKSESGNNSTDIKNNFKSTDIALAMGMSYVKPSTGFGFDLRYNHGLTKINESNPGSAYNSGFQFGLFYLFQHKS